MLSAEQIAAAKRGMKYSHKSAALHEHDDCIRIAYEWLDAQEKTNGTAKRARPIKHLIEGWAGRYISQSDVEVAAAMHPEIIGTYPHFNISLKLTQPSKGRLDGIGEAGKHGNYTLKPDAYTRSEDAE